MKILSIDIGIRNLGMSVVEYNGNTPYTDWKCLSISKLELVDMVEQCQKGKKVREGAKVKNAKTLNIHVLCNCLVQVLLERKDWFNDATEICVEQQPIRGFGAGSMGSSRMKIIQHCILTFFETYFELNSHLVKPKIQSSSPSNKLKLCIDEMNFATAPMEKTDKDTEYKQRKAKSVEQFEKIIKWCTISEEHRSLYTDRKKRDDLADCILQAVFVLQTYYSEKLIKDANQVAKQAEKDAKQAEKNMKQAEKERIKLEKKSAKQSTAKRQKIETQS